MRVVGATPWARAVLHVLAHVDVGAVAASCHCPSWIAWAEERLGPAEERPLAEDARTLARVAGAHDVLARAHGVVWLFDGADDARAVAGKDLADLRDDEVRRPTALRLAREVALVSEILRAAAELELPVLARAPIPDARDEALERELARVRAAAPALDAFAIALAPPLGLRGRVLEDEIVVGRPGFAGADAEHVAWQAAHEATVAEIVARGDPSRHDDVERAAIALLRSRARASGLAVEHARWLSRMDLSALGAIPDVPDGA